MGNDSSLDAIDKVLSMLESPKITARIGGNRVHTYAFSVAGYYKSKFVTASGSDTTVKNALSLLAGRLNAIIKTVDQEGRIDHVLQS